MNIQEKYRDAVIIGAGLTGLTTAYALSRKGANVEVLEQQPRIGGQIHTFIERGYTFESGPNTGAVSYPEITELFESLSPDCEMETACEAAKCRLIWKNGKFHALPSGLSSALTTPLFSWYDKFRILGEPFRKRGTDPDESVGKLTQRRLGKSYFKYAVDPFVSGVYAGNPMKLVTRFALPKLYHLEQDYGSFIRGALAKSKEKKTERDLKATKKVFSAQGGLNRLVDALGKNIGQDHITLNAKGITIQPAESGWAVTYTAGGGNLQTLSCKKVITTAGAYALPDLLPFIKAADIKKISNLYYAPIIQVSVGIRNEKRTLRPSFGGLVPSCEKMPVLGILFPSDCFQGRTPEGCSLYSFFIGGVRNTEALNMTDKEITDLVKEMVYKMLGYDKAVQPEMIHISRHAKAIPQYEISSGERFATIEKIQSEYPGLILAGNIKGGIGMADRIRQALQIAEKG